MIVWLASFPRSGNTMVRILLNRVYGRRSYSLYDERPWEAAQAHLVVAGSAGQVAEADLDELRRGDEPCFVKTHGLPLDDSPALCVVRDGRDALVSYAHYARTYEPEAHRGQSFDDTLRMLIESRDHFGGWSGNVGAWRARSSGAPTAWLRYEDILQHPLDRVVSALRQLGVDVAPAGEAPGFAELHRQWPEFFRKGQAGSWRSAMTEALHILFWRRHHEAMRWFGYDHDGPRGT